ncbi:hypothetical protein ACFV1N_38060 [Streptosporangium canum]|uniref:hypothetical protein n=1 Tax=Streptosporangium canum TaxID=324952 RepID=UPI0036BFFC39
MTTHHPPGPLQALLRQSFHRRPQRRRGWDAMVTSGPRGGSGSLAVLRAGLPAAASASGGPPLPGASRPAGRSERHHAAQQIASP